MLKLLAVRGSASGVDVDAGAVDAVDAGTVVVVVAVAGFAAGAGAVVDWEGRSQPLTTMIRSSARNRGRAE